MRAEFFRSESPAEVVGQAIWRGSSIEVAAASGVIAEAIGRVLRRTPLVIDDRALRAAGSSGPTVLFPGTLEWFRAAARARASEEGLGVRLVPEARSDTMGFDPAGLYRPFAEQMDRRAQP